MREEEKSMRESSALLFDVLGRRLALLLSVMSFAVSVSSPSVLSAPSHSSIHRVLLSALTSILAQMAICSRRVFVSSVYLSIGALPFVRLTAVVSSFLFSNQQLFRLCSFQVNPHTILFNFHSRGSNGNPSPHFYGSRMRGNVSLPQVAVFVIFNAFFSVRVSEEREREREREREIERERERWRMK